MKTLAALSAAALIGLGTLAPSAAEARGGGAVAAGLIGGLAAGALLGAAAAHAHPGPAYGYGYGYGAPYGYAPAYRYDGPVYGPRRVVGYDRAPDRWHRHWDRPAFHGGW